MDCEENEDLTAGGFVFLFIAIFAVNIVKSRMQLSELNKMYRNETIVRTPSPLFGDLHRRVDFCGACHLGRIY